MARTLAILALAVALFLAACGSDQGSPGLAERVDHQSEDGATDGDGIGPIDPDSDDNSGAGDDGDDGTIVPAATSVEFVIAAIEGRDAASHFATTAFDDPAKGNPFDPSVLAGRLIELDELDATPTMVTPSSNAFPDAGTDLAPSCQEGAGLICQIDIGSSSGQIQASVIVHWFDDGITDFSIVTRSETGAPDGIGEAQCDPGYELVHGGHTPDRFDVAVCVDQSGSVQYRGQVRHEDSGIRLDGCRQGDDQWIALNEGYRYLVDGTVSATRSTIQVFNEAGVLTTDQPFTSVRFDPVVTPASC